MIKNQSKVKAVIFDFGNVLIVDGQKVLERLFELDKLPKWKRNRYEAASHDTEKGLKPTKYWLNVIKEVFDLNYTDKEIEQLLLMSQPIKPMLDLLHALRKESGLKLAILTNNQKGWPARFIKQMNLNLKSVPIFNSSLIGARKPQRAPYLFALRNLHVSPSETIFIDDKISNIKTANKIGINGILFNGNTANIIKQLKKFGVQVRI